MEIRLPEVLYLNFYFPKREAFQSHVCGVVRYRKLCVGKQNHSDKKKVGFFLRFVRNTVEYSFREICYEILGRN